jgi:hypothetical protein
MLSIMKKEKIILSICLLLFTGGFYACNDNMRHDLSVADRFAFNGIQTSYANAIIEDEAWKTSLQQNDLDGIHLHDSLFHHFVDLFEEYHGDYSHNNPHDDHHHDAQGIHMGSITNNHGSGDGHHNEDHTVMRNLTVAHDAITH